MTNICQFHGKNFPDLIFWDWIFLAPAEAIEELFFWTGQMQLFWTVVDIISLNYAIFYYFPHK